MQKRKLTKAERARKINLDRIIAERIARENVLVHIAAITPKVMIIHRRSMRGKLLAYDNAVALTESRQKWIVGIYAFCRDERGKEYIKAEQILLPEPVKHNEIHTSMNHHIMAFMRREINRNHLLTLAWAASNQEAPSSEWIDKLATELGTWKKLESACEVNENEEGWVSIKPKEKKNEN